MIYYKKLTAISIACLVSTGYLLANEAEFDSYCPPRESCSPTWMVTPDAGPCVCRGWDTHLTVEFIYWTAREDHLAFAFKEPTESSGTVTGQGRVFDPDWNFEPGFKIGFGVLQNHDGWDVYANYTWLRVRNTKKTIDSDDPITEQITPIGTFGAGGGLSNIDQISARWQLDFNVVDLELGRNFFISQCLTLRPYFGLKGTWQDQDFLTNSRGIFESILSVGETKDCLDYWGVGILAGLDSAWHLTRSLSFLGEVAVSALWERFKVDSKSSNAPIVVGMREPFTFLNVENNFFTIKPILELYLGLRWETWFCCDSYHFSFEGGWEIQWWADQNQFFSTIHESRLGDLYLQGVTLKIRLDF